jgi:hypothetical protein
LESFFNTNISFSLIAKWIKSFTKLLSYDLSQREKEKPKTIEILELDELYAYFYDLKKHKEYVKVWLAMDRNRNKAVAFEVSIDDNKNEDIIYRKLINKVLNDCKDEDTETIQ